MTEITACEDEYLIEDASDSVASVTLPYSVGTVYERVVLDYGQRTVRIDKDTTVSMPHLVADKKNCFIVMSKKDYYLYVYEAQETDTVLVARYDCAFSLTKGDKQSRGDMRTPHCTMASPFHISQIANSSTWRHDFGDGRGSIRSYGDYFMRLSVPGHSGIGIHGSTNNRETVPGRATEGCVRLKDEDLVDLKKHYAFVGMKVLIKDENADDLPFEIRAMQAQKVDRKRHLDPAKTLSNEEIARTRKLEKGRGWGGILASPL